MKPKIVNNPQLNNVSMIKIALNLLIISLGTVSTKSTSTASPSISTSTSLVEPTESSTSQLLTQSTSPASSSTPLSSTEPEIPFKLPPCHLKALDQCLQPMFYFTHRPNTTGITPNPKEFGLMCKATMKMLICVDEYMKQCSTLLMREFWQLGRNQLVSSFSRICNNGTMRQNYLKYSPCIHAKVKLNPKYKSTCVNDLQATLEYLTEFEEVEDWLNIGCCGYNAWEQCIQRMTFEQCGGEKESNHAVADLIDAATGGMIHLICTKHDFQPESTLCQKSLPPKGTKAKGKHSNSPASKYFTLICPNTGF